jgi:hypothetical protein
MLSKKMLLSLPKLRTRSVLAIPKHFGGILYFGWPSPQGAEDTGIDSRSRKRKSLLDAGSEMLA